MKPETMDKKMQSISHNVPDVAPEPYVSFSYTGDKLPPAIAPADNPGYFDSAYNKPLSMKPKDKPTHLLGRIWHAVRFLSVLLAIPLTFIAADMLDHSIGSDSLFVYFVSFSFGIFYSRLDRELSIITIAKAAARILKQLWNLADPK